TSTLLDQAHHAIERKLFTMKGFHHPGGSQQAFLTGLAHLSNLIPYQRRAKHAGQCGVEVEGGRVPTADWVLNLQILTSAGIRRAGIHLTTKSGGMWYFPIQVCNVFSCTLKSRAVWAMDCSDSTASVTARSLNAAGYFFVVG